MSYLKNVLKLIKYNFLSIKYRFIIVCLIVFIFNVYMFNDLLIRWIIKTVDKQNTKEIITTMEKNINKETNDIEYAEMIVEPNFKDVVEYSEYCKRKKIKVDTKCCTIKHGQDKEDQVIYDLIFSKTHKNKVGFFLEMGALDGISLSNTLFFERCLNWRGLLIEPNIKSFEKLISNRIHNTINIPYACCKERGFIKLVGQGSISFSPGAMNNKFEKTFYGSKQQITLTQNIISIPCKPMKDILKELKIDRIDFFSLDVEGAEVDVLDSIDFSVVEINVILIESDLTFAKEETVSKFRDIMKRNNFELFENIVIRSDLFINKNFLELTKLNIKS